MGTFPLYARRVIHSLDGVWNFVSLGEDVDLSAPRHVPEGHLDRMPVPGCFDASPTYAGRRGTAAYRTQVRTTPGRAGLLRVGGLGLWARILVDGQILHETNLPYETVRRLFAPGTGSEA